MNKRISARRLSHRQAAKQVSPCLRPSDSVALISGEQTSPEPKRVPGEKLFRSHKSPLGKSHSHIQYLKPGEGI